MTVSIVATAYNMRYGSANTELATAFAVIWRVILREGVATDLTESTADSAGDTSDGAVDEPPGVEGTMRGEDGADEPGGRDAAGEPVELPMSIEIFSSSRPRSTTTVFGSIF